MSFALIDRRHRLCAVATAVAGCFVGGLATAQPVGVQAQHGTAILTQQGNLTTVTTQNGAGTAHSAIDWQSFGVAAGNRVYFAQPHSQSTSINRVLGPDPSAIFGTLGSNGKLVLVNPAGIAVGAGAVVDTAGFTASTLRMSTADAIGGRLRFGEDGTAGTGALSVQGSIVARGGDIVLIAPHVETGARAVVESIGGDTILAAGRQVEITGRGVEGIRMQIQAPGDRAVNLGALKGDSVAMFANQLRHSGMIQARSASVVGGRVVLTGVDSATLDGSITAVGPQAGGAVHVTAERVAVQAATAIDVSHPNGAGEILIGGGWQGRDARVANAREVDVERGAVLQADATVAGPGGTVVVWSDDTTRFRGSVLARGAGGGAGGNAEVSGKQHLVFRGQADLAGADGKAGQLLLDPAIVTIVGGAADGDDNDGSSSNFNNPPGGPGVLTSATGPSSFTIYESELEGVNADISIQATQQIQVAGTFTNGLLISNNRNIRLEVVTGTPGGIDLTGVPLQTQGSGTVQLITASAGQNIFTGGIKTANRPITITANAADVHIGGAGLNAGTANLSLKGLLIDNTGTITLAGNATLSTNGGSLANLPGGVIEGYGLVDLGTATMTSSGTLRPGGTGAINKLEVKGNVVLGATSRLEVDIDSSSTSDELKINAGNITLGGDLYVTAIATPGSATEYTFVDASLRLGTFAGISAPPSLSTFVPAYEAQKMKLVAGTPPAPVPPPPPPAPPPPAPPPPAPPPPAPPPPAPPPPAPPPPAPPPPAPPPPVPPPPVPPPPVPPPPPPALPPIASAPSPASPSANEPAPAQVGAPAPGAPRPPAESGGLSTTTTNVPPATRTEAAAIADQLVLLPAQAVQFSSNEQARQVESFMRRAAWLQAESSDLERHQGAILLTPVQCRI